MNYCKAYCRAYVEKDDKTLLELLEMLRNKINIKTTECSFDDILGMFFVSSRNRYVCEWIEGSGHLDMSDEDANDTFIRIAKRQLKYAQDEVQEELTSTTKYNVRVKSAGRANCPDYKKGLWSGECARTRECSSEQRFLGKLPCEVNTVQGISAVTDDSNEIDSLIDNNAPQVSLEDDLIARERRKTLIDFFDALPVRECVFFKLRFITYDIMVLNDGDFGYIYEQAGKTRKESEAFIANKLKENSKKSYALSTADIASLTGEAGNGEGKYPIIEQSVSRTKKKLAAFWSLYDK